MTEKMTPGEQLELYRDMVATGELARSVPKRAPARRRPRPEQLEILDPAEAARRDLVAAQRQAYRERRKTCPDGRELPEGMTWCGRCGEIIWNYSLVINHDLGYCGCPVEFDPSWKDDAWRREIHTFGARGHLDRETLNDRWDRQFFPDCVCGDSCGIHCEDGLCIACYRCHEYRPRKRRKTNAGHQPRDSGKGGAAENPAGEPGPPRQHLRKSVGGLPQGGDSRAGEHARPD